MKTLQHKFVEFVPNTIEEGVGKSGDTDHLNPVQTDHPKLTSFSCGKKVAFLC